MEPAFAPTAVLTPLRPKDAESSRPARARPRRARRLRRAELPADARPTNAAPRRRTRGRPSLVDVDIEVERTEEIVDPPGAAFKRKTPVPVIEGALDSESAADVVALALGTTRRIRRQSKSDMSLSDISSPIIMRATSSRAKSRVSRALDSDTESDASEEMRTTPVARVMDQMNTKDEEQLKLQALPSDSISSTISSLPIPSQSFSPSSDGRLTIDNTGSTNVAYSLEKEEDARRAERRAKWRAARDLTYSYNVELKELSKRRDLNGCLELLQEMRTKGARLDAYTYSTILTCCAKTKATQTALELYGRMLSERVRVDEHVLVTMMSIAGRASPPLVEMLRALFHQSAAPTRVTCNAFIDGLANAGLVSDVEGVLRYMHLRDLGCDTYTATSVAKAYVRTGRMKEAEERLAELERRTPSVRCAGAHNVIIAAYSAEGDVTAAHRVFKALGPLASQTSYNVLIGCYCRTGSVDMEAAFDIFDTMLRAGFSGDRYTMHGLMKVCLAAGNGAVALHTYMAFRETRASWSLNNVSYRLAATAAGMARDSWALNEIVEDSRRNRIVLRMDAAAAFVAAALRCGLDQDAINYTQRYIGTADHPESFFLQVTHTLAALPMPHREELPHADADSVVAELERTWVTLGRIGA